MKREIAFIARWVALSAVGMSAGVLLAGELIALVLWRWDGLHSVPASIALLTTLFVAGAGHGAAMGAAQSVLLRRRTGIDRRNWILVTAAGAAIAWMIGGTINFIDAGPWDAAERMRAILLGGLALGALLGTAQWLLLRRHVEDSLAWVPANALAWVVGTGLGVIALDSFPPDPAPLQLVVSAALATLLPGAAAGLVTGFTLRSLLQPEKQPA